MIFKNKKIMFLFCSVILFSFVVAIDYPFNEAENEPYFGVVEYPSDSFQEISCPADNIIFRLSSVDNAHAAVYSGNYEIISCSPFGPVARSGIDFDGDGVFDNIALRLSDDSNAHAEKSSSSDYIVDVYGGDVLCGYAGAGETCDGVFSNDLDVVCVGAISGDSNAHVSDCESADINGYDKICCQPVCRIAIDHTEDGNDIRAVYWEKDLAKFKRSAAQNNMVAVKVVGEGYCSSKTIDFGIYAYNAFDQADSLILVDNTFFVTREGEEISCTDGVCRANFKDNVVSRDLVLDPNFFLDTIDYYFAFNMNGENYFSNRLNIAREVAVGCGNGIIEKNNGEVCDPPGSDTTVSCSALGFEGEGMDGVFVGCTSECRFDTNVCEGEAGLCDGVALNPGEECDDDSIDLNNLECGIINPRWAGSLSCIPESCLFDIADCGGYCGNGIREDQSKDGAEVCDGTDIPVTCQDLGYSGGVMGCSGCGLNVDGCTCLQETATCNPRGSCGDGKVSEDLGEQCDPNSNLELSCSLVSSAWTGKIGCTEFCELDFSECIPTCGNGRLDDNEVCDPTSVSTSSNPNPRISCTDLGFTGGNIDCTEQCNLDTNSCTGGEGDICGDDELRASEECDGDLLESLDECKEVSSRWRGDLECRSDCTIDFSDCEVVETSRCVSCDDCNTFFGNCGYDQCVNFCAVSGGGCYFDENLILPDRCKDCSEITQCSDYTSEDDCEAHKDEGLPGGRCIGYALDETGQVADCRWDYNQNKCIVNTDCNWVCPNLETVYGECQSDDFRYPVSGSAARCASSPLDESCGLNGYINLPPKIKCGKYSEEEVFPVFDNLNILLSIILLIGYYLIRNRKNEKA